MASSHANSAGAFNAERGAELKPVFNPSAGESTKLIVGLARYNISSKINFREKARFSWLRRNRKTLLIHIADRRKLVCEVRRNMNVLLS